MIEVTDLFKEMAQKYYRNVDFKIVSNDDESTVYSGDIILECQINRSVGSSGIQIGNAISDRLQFTLKSTDKIKSGTRLTPYVRYKGEENTEWLRLGRFYCTESKMSNGILTVTAYDRLYNFDKRCAFGGRDSIQALSFPATHQQMWDYVCALRGVESDFQCADFTVSERPLANPNAEDDSKYYTQRQIVGMIAACNAGNAVIDNNGKLTVRRFANQTYTLNKNRCFTQEIDTAEQFQVKGVLFHVDSENDIFIDDNASEYSEDREGIIVCDNALATVGVAEYVWNKLGNLKYSGCEITRRGVGWLDTGETIQVEDFYDAEGGAVNVITSEIDYAFSYDNGFTETIRSVAETAEQSGNRAVASNSDTGAVATPSVEKFTNFVANSDGTYTYNGVTYGFETDEGTGYITRVYDNGNNGVIIDTTNAAVNSGKVDFNTAVMAMAMVCGIGQRQHGTKYIYQNGEINAELIVDNYKGYDAYTDVSWSDSAGASDLSALDNGYNVRAKQSNGLYWTFNADGKKIEKLAGSASGCTTIMFTPIKPMKAKKLYASVTFVSGQISPYCEARVSLVRAENGAIVNTNGTVYTVNSSLTYPFTTEISIDLDESIYYNSFSVQACIGSVYVDKIWVEY